MELGIALCKRDNNNCPKKDECLRYTQITGEYDFINFMNIKDTGNGFNCFWSNGSNNVVVEKDEDKDEIKEEPKTDN